MTRSPVFWMCHSLHLGGEIVTVIEVKIRGMIQLRGERPVYSKSRHGKKARRADTRGRLYPDVITYADPLNLGIFWFHRL